MKFERRGDFRQQRRVMVLHELIAQPANAPPTDVTMNRIQMTGRDHLGGGRRLEYTL